MPIQTYPLGPLDTNCYIIYQNKAAMVVDPGGDPTEVVNFLQEKGLALQAIVITHRHFDHLYGVAELHQKTQAPVYAPAGDDVLASTESGKGGIWGFPPVPPFAAEPISVGEQHFGDIACTVLLTPGHTPGSISLYFPTEHAVVTGDVIFYRSIGRTDFPMGNSEDLLNSIRTQIFTLPKDTAIYAGHGPATTVGDEITNNPYCGAFTR